MAETREQMAELILSFLAVSPTSPMHEAALRAGAAALRAQKECVWSQMDEDSTTYESTCKHNFEFNDGGPRENGFTVCPYCGGTLAVEPCEPEP